MARTPAATLSSMCLLACAPQSSPPLHAPIERDPDTLRQAAPIAQLQITHDTIEPDSETEGSEEVCDGIDNDGDGEIDEGFDLDGDTWPGCGPEPDCDDVDAAVHPGADEIDGDLRDNNCDGLFDDGHWGSGALVINEIMANPAAAPDPDGEWFELVSVHDQPIVLNGLRIEASGEYTVVRDGLISIEPGEHLVFGAEARASLNGGVSIDHVYSGLSLSNEAGSLVLRKPDELVDEVHWDHGLTFPHLNGASMELDPDRADASQNDEGESWCPAIQSWSMSSDFGSPGTANARCSSADHDADGVTGLDGDCDDTDPTIFPGADEIWYDDIDQNCDGRNDHDADGDGWERDEDCDDFDATVVTHCTITTYALGGAGGEVSHRLTALRGNVILAETSGLLRQFRVRMGVTGSCDVDLSVYEAPDLADGGFSLIATHHAELVDTGDVWVDTGTELIDVPFSSGFYYALIWQSDCHASAFEGSRDLDPGFGTLVGTASYTSLGVLDPLHAAIVEESDRAYDMQIDLYE